MPALTVQHLGRCGSTALHVLADHVDHLEAEVAGGTLTVDVPCCAASLRVIGAVASMT